jgi:PAS domain S-box-containing protein
MAGTDGAEPGSGDGLRGPNRLAALLENSPVGLAVLAPDGAFLEVNPVLVRMLGWAGLRAPDLVGGMSG